MSSSGKTLGIIGLIIGICGLALGGFSTFTLLTTTDATSIKGTWFDTDDTASLVVGFTQIDDLGVSFNVNAGENIYVSYNSYVKIEGYYAYFQIYIDSVARGYQMQVTQDDNTLFERYSITLTFLFEASWVASTLGYGAHNCTIWASADDLTTIVSSNTLLVQTFV